MDPQIWTSKEILTAVIATGIISAMAREVFEWIKANTRKDREIRYLSVGAAIALEAFAIECKDLAEGMEAHYEQYRAVGSIAIPAAPQLPADCDWRLIDVTLMNELLSFRNAVRQAQSDADFAFHFEGNTWSHVTAVKALGDKADALAIQLRRNVGLN